MTVKQKKGIMKTNIVTNREEETKRLKAERVEIPVPEDPRIKILDHMKMVSEDWIKNLEIELLRDRLKNASTNTSNSNDILVEYQKLLFEFNRDCIMKQSGLREHASYAQISPFPLMDGSDPMYRIMNDIFREICMLEYPEFYTNELIFEADCMITEIFFHIYTLKKDYPDHYLWDVLYGGFHFLYQIFAPCIKDHPREDASYEANLDTILNLLRTVVQPDEGIRYKMDYNMMEDVVSYDIRMQELLTKKTEFINNLEGYQTTLFDQYTLGWYSEYGISEILPIHYFQAFIEMKQAIFDKDCNSPNKRVHHMTLADNVEEFIGLYPFSESARNILIGGINLLLSIEYTDDKKEESEDTSINPMIELMNESLDAYDEMEIIEEVPVEDDASREKYLEARECLFELNKLERFVRMTAGVKSAEEACKVYADCIGEDYQVKIAKARTAITNEYVLMIDPSVSSVNTDKTIRQLIQEDILDVVHRSTAEIFYTGNKIQVCVAGLVLTPENHTFTEVIETSENVIHPKGQEASIEGHVSIEPDDFDRSLTEVLERNFLREIAEETTDGMGNKYVSSLKTSVLGVYIDFTLANHLCFHMLATGEAFNEAKLYQIRSNEPEKHSILQHNIHRLIPELFTYPIETFDKGLVLLLHRIYQAIKVF